MKRCSNNTITVYTKGRSSQLSLFTYANAMVNIFTFETRYAYLPGREQPRGLDELDGDSDKYNAIQTRPCCLYTPSTWAGRTRALQLPICIENRSVAGVFVDDIIALKCRSHIGLSCASQGRIQKMNLEGANSGLFAVEGSPLASWGGMPPP